MGLGASAEHNEEIETSILIYKIRISRVTVGSLVEVFQSRLSVTPQVLCT